MNKELAGIFDTEVSAYDKFRPGYVNELYQTIFKYCPIDSSCNVLEIGIGSGQATLPILQTGCNFHAVEYGEHFTELCKERFRLYPGFSVFTNRFEDADLENETYDLVFSATAFHWIPEEIGYPKVFSVLKKNGVFARFANHPFRDKTNPALAEEIDWLYSKYYYSFYNKEPQMQKEYGEEQAQSIAYIAEKYGFEDICYSLYQRKRTFAAGEYCELLGTYSDHIAIKKEIRAEFFSKIEDAIERHGGEITIYDTMDLQLARKSLNMIKQ